MIKFNIIVSIIYDTSNQNAVSNQHIISNIINMSINVSLKSKYNNEQNANTRGTTQGIFHPRNIIEYGVKKVGK